MNEAIVDIAVALVADAVPEIIADAIDGLVENSEDRVVRTVATILSTYVRDNGEEALEEVAELLIDTSEPSATAPKSSTSYIRPA